MATKKQKREAAQAKRAEFEAKIKADGLKALARAQAHEAQLKAGYKEQAEKQQAKITPVLEFTNDDLVRAHRLAVALFIGESVED